MGPWGSERTLDATARRDANVPHIYVAFASWQTSRTWYVVPLELDADVFPIRVDANEAMRPFAWRRPQRVGFVEYTVVVSCVLDSCHR
jgi:hypothetical protein